MKQAKLTIIELLLVVAIAGIMLAVAVPSFSRLMKGSGPGLSARELMGKINAARAYASANRVNVAIVFPNAESSELGKSTFRNGIKENYAYQSYRVCEVYSGDGGTSWNFLRWVPGENWKQVPKGVLIGTKDDASGFEPFQQAQTGTDPTDSKFEGKVGTTTADLNSSALQNCIFEKTFHSSGNTEITIPISNYIIIQSNGMIKNMTPALIKIRQGSFDGTTIKQPDGKAYLPLVVRFNGKVKAYNELVEP